MKILIKILIGIYLAIIACFFLAVTLDITGLMPKKKIHITQDGPSEPPPGWLVQYNGSIQRWRAMRSGALVQPHGDSNLFEDRASAVEAAWKIDASFYGNGWRSDDTTNRIKEVAGGVLVLGPDTRRENARPTNAVTTNVLFVTNVETNYISYVDGSFIDTRVQKMMTTNGVWIDAIPYDPEGDRRRIDREWKEKYETWDEIYKIAFRAGLNNAIEKLKNQ